LLHKAAFVPDECRLLDEWNLSRLGDPGQPQTFYFAGLVERWGTGTIRIIELCRQQGLLEPQFQNQQGGFLVTFFKNPYTP
jgi:ATP-dependent DNA helicase RecG